MERTVAKGLRAARHGAIAGIAMAALAACTTPYQPRGARGGFTEQKLAEGRYSVEFRGNGNTSADLVANMFLYRCAELTVRDGYDVFSSADPSAPAASGLAQPMADAGAADAQPTDFRSGGGGGVRTIYVPSAPVTLHRMTGVVRMARYADLPSNMHAWDARAVMRRLDGVVHGHDPKALKPDEIAKVALVPGRGQPASAAGSRTSLDDLRQLLSQPQD